MTMSSSLGRVCLILAAVLSIGADKPNPLVVAHRGLLKHTPENTLSNFRACLELRVGFEVDVRRTKDGHLVCVHDDSVDRTTNGRGAVRSLTLDELQKLDAGTWFGKAFQGERIPTLDEVLTTLGKQTRSPVLIAIDLKVQEIEADTVRLAKSRGVLDQLLFIGTAIDDVEVRRKLRAADPSAHVACLAGAVGDLPAAVDDKTSDWAYLRFVPAPDDIARIHKAGKRAFIAGPTVAGLEHDNWKRAMQSGIDGLLTDFPLELAPEIRSTAGSTKSATAK
jgi:glycerophosphoryl diester phosphodiesterase